MVVMILERVPPGLRGEIRRWMIEPRAGVFVGKLSAMVQKNAVVAGFGTNSETIVFGVEQHLRQFG